MVSQHSVDMQPRILHHLGRQAAKHALEHGTRTPRACYVANWLQSRGFATSAKAREQEIIPLRKHLKEEAKRKRAAEKGLKREQSESRSSSVHHPDWELTVGIEVHAQLNTRHKLFSDAVTDEEVDVANHNVALFDAAMPGSQPVFQPATLIPALRAALALQCSVQHESAWDRKHYFHWDQPNGYQITQYYRPFAKDGQIVVTAEDGVPAADLQGVQALTIGIKQVQMEQDTAKTTQQSTSHHIDLNRAGHPLIEIITLPQIHSPQTAAAVVRKLQSLLKSVDACATGMELGGLRADVNVSVRRRGTQGQHGYSGVSGLGQRTEIKNLSSFKAIEDAVIAERDRQISVLEAGGVIEGETRGWTIGATSTTRLRGKEGEVDYRYTPDADLPPLLIAQGLIEHINDSMPELPPETIARVQQTYGLTPKDARTIVALDDGDRLDFLEQTARLLQNDFDDPLPKLGKLVGNWVIHELGGLLTTEQRSWSSLSITPQQMADVLSHLISKKITARSAKLLLSMLIADHDPESEVAKVIEQHNLLVKPMAESEYANIARRLITEHSDIADAVRNGKHAKAMWFVGQLIRTGEDGVIDPAVARKVVEREFGL